MYQALNEVGYEKYTQQLKEFMRNYDQDKEDQRQNKAQVAATKRNIEFIEDEEDQEMDQ